MVLFWRLSVAGWAALLKQTAATLGVQIPGDYRLSIGMSPLITVTGCQRVSFLAIQSNKTANRPRVYLEQVRGPPLERLELESWRTLAVRKHSPTRFGPDQKPLNTSSPFSLYFQRKREVNSCSAESPIPSTLVVYLFIQQLIYISSLHCHQFKISVLIP